MGSSITILAIEDQDVDFFLLSRYLKHRPKHHVLRAHNLKQGCDLLENAHFDVILLDLTLPDSSGLNTVQTIVDLEQAPVVVMSGLDDEQTALESVQLGAQDYLVKGKFDSTLLIRTLSYSIERHRLMEALEATRQEVRRERELRQIQRDVLLTRSLADDSLNEENSIKSVNRELHESLLMEYSSLLDKALEQRILKVAHNLSNVLKNMSIDLGNQRATVRDVIEIHTEVVKSRQSLASSEKNRILHEEARYLLAGLLGYLCSFY